MSSPRFAPPTDPAAPRSGPLARWRRFFLDRWIGRVILASAAVVGASVAGLPLPGLLTAPAWVVTLFFMAYGGVRALAWTSRRLLWRIRSKMILSYLFIAVAPIVLLTVFFLIAGFLGLLLVASYAVATHMGRVALELEASTRTSIASLRGGGAAGLEKGLAPLRSRYPGLAFALFRDGKRVAVEGSAPEGLPAWLPESGFAGLVKDGRTEWLRAAWRQGPVALVLQVPVDEALFAAVLERTGVRVFSVGGTVDSDERGVRVRVGPERGDDPDPDIDLGQSRPIKLPGPQDELVTSMALVDVRRWDTGKQTVLPMMIRFDPAILVQRLSPGNVGLGGRFGTALGVLGALFVVLYIVPLGLGLLLARSITRSVHELSRGTVHLRQGDFRHQIPVRSRDQLGELAESFNVMARGIEDLLHEQAEKQRLEEELRIARQIQMSLLPQVDVSVPGIVVAAACIPAAEVGGDYYDVLPLDDGRLAVLVADVSGKGTSAALYMAELKGLMLSLSRVHASPHRLLCEANRILATSMDVRSFITMTYAVVDTAARVMRFARAGHNPLLRLAAGATQADVLTPSGLGLGMDRGDRFEALLQEVELPLAAGDLYLFFTDGISEAMNARGDLFGEERLASLLEGAASLEGGAPEALKEEVLREVKRFVGEAPQHDDMTMVVLKVV